MNFEACKEKRGNAKRVVKGFRIPVLGEMLGRGARLTVARSNGIFFRSSRRLGGAFVLGVREH